MESFYVITGSAAAALTGLTFVVITVMADLRARGSGHGVAAFNTPTVVHFCAVLLLAATLSAPWPALDQAAIVIGLIGLAGAVYVLVVSRRLSRFEDYHPDWEDWTYHACLPLVGYAALVVAAILLARAPIASLFAIATATLLLLFIGIHNAWDVVSYLTVQHMQSPGAAQDASPGSPVTASQAPRQALARRRLPDRGDHRLADFSLLSALEAASLSLRTRHRRADDGPSHAPAAAQGALPRRPDQLPHHAAGAGQPDRRADRVLGRPRPRDLRGPGPQRRRRGRTGACSGDLLLGALAACAQITCQMVATAMGIPTRSIEVIVEGDMDLRGTLGIARDVPVGFEAIRTRFEIDAPEATPEQLEALREKTEQYCVVMQTLRSPPKIEVAWGSAEGAGAEARSSA